MPTNHPTVLALIVNARGIGYALLTSPRHLINFGMMTVRPLCNARLKKRIVTLLDYCKPQVLVLQDTDSKASRAGPRARTLVQDMLSLAAERGLPVHTISREQVREVFETFHATTKYEIAHIIAQEHRVLTSKMPKKRVVWRREDHNQGIFDAMSLALTFYYLND